MNYKGPLYGKIGRRYIPLTLTSDDVDEMSNEIKDLKVDRKIFLDRAEKAETRTRYLLRVELLNEPWREIPTVQASIRCDIKSLCMKPEAFCQTIANELVARVKNQANHF